MRIWVPCLLVCFSLLAGISLADIAIEGVENYNYQYQIVNTDEFPDAVFITSSEIWGYEDAALVVNGSFGGGYKLDGFILHALNETSPDSVLSELFAGNETGGMNLTGYLETAPLVTSNLSLPVSIALEETLGVENVTVDLTIDNLTPTALNVSKINLIYGYTDGTVRVLPAEGEDVPEPGSLIA